MGSVVHAHAHIYSNYNNNTIEKIAIIEITIMSMRLSFVKPKVNVYIKTVGILLE